MSGGGLALFTAESVGLTPPRTCTGTFYYSSDSSSLSPYVFFFSPPAVHEDFSVGSLGSSGQ